MKTVRSGWLALFLAAWPALAQAQAYQCRVPGAVSVPEIRPDGPRRTVPVTGYTLALSWSPEFCRTRAKERAHARQCSGRGGTFGFIVHGLWPDGARSWPQWCPTKARPTGREIAGQLCRSPSARLVARQWAKHGACMVRRPETYLNVTNILFDSLRWPDFDRLSRKDDLTANDVREWFVMANRGWRTEAVGVRLNARGWLTELRLCYDSRFRPARCDRQRYGAADAAPVRIWRGL